MIYNYIIYYLLIGTILNMLYDFMVNYLQNKGKTQDMRFSIKQRFFVALIWPIYLTFFIINFFIQLSKNKNND